MKIRLALVVFTILVSACSSELPTIVGCEARDGIRPVCGMQSPEDIAATADGRHLLLAHFGGMEDGTGSLSLFDTREETVLPLFAGTAEAPVFSDKSWGDATCSAPDPAAFSPHGTHLHTLDNGRWRYLVVNHGGRESIEMFELFLDGKNSSLEWRGCVLPAPETFMNDVVGLSNGDVIYSRMFHHGGDLEMLKSLIGIDTGDIWRWSQSSGLRVLPGTEAAQPNGLEISADNRYVFANMYMEREVWKIDAAAGGVVAVGEAPNADNSAWGTDGRLWIAVHEPAGMSLLSCFDDQAAPCSAAFEIYAMDPETMATEIIFAHSGAPMGAVTVAVPQAGRVYMGSFVGDRMISVPQNRFEGAGQ
jgi:sugar lactone lactonase YvrE